MSSLATNKLPDSPGTGSAVITFAFHVHIEFSKTPLMIATTFTAAGLGGLAVAIAPTPMLSATMPALLIVMAIYFTFSPRLSDATPRPRTTVKRFWWMAAPSIGSYDGVSGPSAGSFYLLGSVRLLGYGVLRASAHTKLLNFNSTPAYLLIFPLSGKVLWTLGLTMRAGQFLGSQLGSRLAIRNGAKLIRPLLVMVCRGMAIKLLADPAIPPRGFFP